MYPSVRHCSQSRKYQELAVVLVGILVPGSFSFPLTAVSSSLYSFSFPSLKKTSQFIILKKYPWMKTDSIWWLVLPLKKISLYFFCYTPWFSLCSSICAFIGILLYHLLEVWNVSFGCNIDFDLRVLCFFFLQDIYMKAESLILVTDVFFLLLIS